MPHHSQASTFRYTFRGVAQLLAGGSRTMLASKKGKGRKDDLFRPHPRRAVGTYSVWVPPTEQVGALLTVKAVV